MISFEKCYTKLNSIFALSGIEFFSNHVYHFKTRGSHFEIQHLCYNRLARSDYGGI